MGICGHVLCVMSDCKALRTNGGCFLPGRMWPECMWSCRLPCKSSLLTVNIQLD